MLNNHTKNPRSKCLITIVLKSGINCDKLYVGHLVKWCARGLLLHCDRNYRGVRVTYYYRGRPWPTEHLPCICLAAIRDDWRRIVETATLQRNML